MTVSSASYHSPSLFKSRLGAHFLPLHRLISLHQKEHTLRLVTSTSRKKRKQKSRNSPRAREQGHALGRSFRRWKSEWGANPLRPKKKKKKKKNNSSTPAHPASEPPHQKISPSIHQTASRKPSPRRASRPCGRAWAFSSRPWPRAVAAAAAAAAASALPPPTTTTSTRTTPWAS